MTDEELKEQNSVLLKALLVIWFPTEFTSAERVDAKRAARRLIANRMAADEEE